MENFVRRTLHRLFNWPPKSHALYIADNHGKKFWIHWNSSDCLSISYRGWPVGRVCLDFRKDGEVILADIIIYVNLPHGYNFRNHGLGKAMIQEAIRYAKERRAKFIWGWIEPDEYVTEEYLAEWYRRQGFQVLSGSIYYELQTPKEGEI